MSGTSIIAKISMSLTTQVKEATSFIIKWCHITKQLLTSISVDIRIYLPLKVIFTSA